MKNKVILVLVGFLAGFVVGYFANNSELFKGWIFFDFGNTVEEAGFGFVETVDPTADVEKAGFGFVTEEAPHEIRENSSSNSR